VRLSSGPRLRLTLGHPLTLSDAFAVLGVANYVLSDLCLDYSSRVFGSAIGKPDLFSLCCSRLRALVDIDGSSGSPVACRFRACD